MDVTATIVIYKNDPKILNNAIRSFLTSALEISLFIIDNSPDDELKNQIVVDSRITYIHMGRNLGFGKAHNIGMSKSIDLRAKYHLVLNPDIIFKPGVIDKIFGFMQSNEEFGLLMPKVVYPNGELQYLCKRPPSLSVLLLRRFMPKAIQDRFKRKLDEYEYRDHDYNQMIFDVPYLSGCFMFFRNAVLQQLGGFDQKIFMYMEDADITYRTLTYSRTIYYPDVEVTHHFAKGSYKNLKLMYYNIHGAIVYFRKWGWRF